MKVIYSVVLLLAAFAAIHCAPAEKKVEKEATPDKDVDFVPLEGKGSGFLPGGVVDLDAGGDGFFGNPFGGNPFPSLLGSIEELMARMRQQLSQILGRLPENSGEASFPGLRVPNLEGIDLGKGNTTSVTKVIDGHKVTINETEYKQDGENGASFFKVRIIDVHPDSEEASTEADSQAVPAPKRDRESVEDPSNNEIQKQNEALNFENIETFDEVDVVPPHKNMNTRGAADWNNIRSVESIEENSIDGVPQPIRDLSNDIYVNQLMADAGAPTNPDAEIFNVAEGPFKYYPQQRSQKIVPQQQQPPRYGFPQQGAFPFHFPQHFEPFGMQRGPVAAFGPMFPMSPQQYGLPPNKMVRETSQQIVTHPSLPTQNNGLNVPQQQSFSSKLQIQSNAIPQGEVKHHESAPVSNIPPQSLPVTNSQVPSTST